VNEREVARELLRELLHGALDASNGRHAAGAAPAAPPAPDAAPPAPEAGPQQVPAPPVAAVLRPSTWGGDAAESVTIDSDADLDRFVRALAARLEDPAERAAVRDGRRRFALRRGAGPGARGSGPGAGGTTRIDRGAVTERTVEQAAKAGNRLVLGTAAVLTPLAREKARALGIEIERERRC
jgi:hypothetical protein